LTPGCVSLILGRDKRMNVFSSPEMLSTVAAVFFPGAPARARWFRVADRLFLLPEVNGEGVTSWPFMDFLEPAQPGDDADASSDAGQLPFLPKVALERVTAEAWRAGGLDASVAPCVDWSQFASHADFLAHVHARRSGLAADGRRRSRRLEREVGPLRMLADDPRPDVLEQCFRWKSRQYVESGYPDAFAVGAHATLFRELAKRGLLKVSSLSAGDRLLAVHAGMLHDRRFYYWVPAFDGELRAYSPGRLLLDEMLKASLARGDGEFDFLIGDEPYKWHYATHARPVTPLGVAPWPQRLRGSMRRFAHSLRRRYPALDDLERRLRRLPPRKGDARDSAGSG
jgi:hypothetical protein